MPNLGKPYGSRSQKCIFPTNGVRSKLMSPPSRLHSTVCSSDLVHGSSHRCLPRGALVEPCYDILYAGAERIRTPLFKPSGAFSELHRVAQDRLKQEAVKLVNVYQRSSSNVEWRKGYLSLRSHERRSLDNPRKRACLPAIHNFLLTRSDGTTATERFFGRSPARCLPRFSRQSRYSQCPSVHRGEPWGRPKGIGWPPP